MSDVTKATNVNHQEDLSSPGGLLKVQDLLFGSQLREIEQRFAMLETRVNTMEDDHHASLKRAVQTLDERIASERDEHSQALKRAQRQHDDALAELRRDLEKQTREMGELASRLDKRHAAIEEDINEARRLMSDKLEVRAKGISEDLSRAVQQANSALDQAVDRLHDQKADRAVLSEWMMEMALRLTNQGNDSRRNAAAKKPAPIITTPAPAPSTNPAATSRPAVPPSSAGTSFRTEAAPASPTLPKPVVTPSKP